MLIFSFSDISVLVTLKGMGHFSFDDFLVLVPTTECKNLSYFLANQYIYFSYTTMGNLLFCKQLHLEVTMIKALYSP